MTRRHKDLFRPVYRRGAKLKFNFKIESDPLNSLPGPSRMIRLRKHRLFPRQISDAGAFIFVTLMIPFTYIYEVQVPTYRDGEGLLCHHEIRTYFNLLNNFFKNVAGNAGLKGYIYFGENFSTR